MSGSRRAPRPRRAAILVASALAAAGLLAAATPGAGGDAGRPAPAVRSTAGPSGDPSVPPGSPPPQMKRFRFPPGSGAIPWRVLVIPVRFPEDGVLGGGGPDSLAARLNGESISDLRGFYRAATRGRLLVEATLTPVVVADHARTFYTSEGEGNGGYGLDPDAWPHNARFLVEEVTEKLAPHVDFRRFDNTGDGFADGLLILHSGPSAAEGETSLPPDVLLPHAFTLEAPVPRGDGTVFAYAAAATRDPIGPWAHETGHLLGLPDLYVANPFFPGDGVGRWSLMATGANVGGGTTPAGLDAASRVFLGVEPALMPAGAADLAGGGIVRVFRPGEEAGPEYFLVERRTGDDGLYLPAPATVVFRVDEGAGDNRNPLRPLVELRAQLCVGARACSATLDDGSDPSLRDGDDDPTGLRLLFVNDTVETRVLGGFRVTLDAASLLPPRDGEDPTILPLALVLRNHAGEPVDVALTVEPAAASGFCAGTGDGAPWRRTLPARASLADTAWRFEPCAPSSTPAPGPVETRFAWTLDPGGDAAESTRRVSFAAGLPAAALASYTSVNLQPGRENPWTLDAESGTWTAAALDSRADAAIESPWFVVPPRAVLVLDHAWSLPAPGPDAALDAGRVALVPAGGIEIPVAPGLGFGYEADRGTGSALAGARVLAGAGDRVTVIDLSAHAGATARLRLRVSGDTLPGGGSWFVRSARVAEVSAEDYGLEVLDGWVAAVAPADARPETEVRLLAGPPPGPPSNLLASGSGASPPRARDAAAPGEARRYSLVWISPDGRAGAVERLVVIDPPALGSVVHPSPNPVGRGAGQAWTVDVSEATGLGRHVLTLLDAAGRIVAREEATWMVPGRRWAPWDGRTDDERFAAPGIYFLHVRFPDGRIGARKVVILP